MLARLPKWGSGTQKWESGHLNPLPSTGLLCPKPAPARGLLEDCSITPFPAPVHSRGRMAGDECVFDPPCASARAYLG